MLKLWDFCCFLILATDTDHHLHRIHFSRKYGLRGLMLNKNTTEIYCKQLSLSRIFKKRDAHRRSLKCLQCNMHKDYSCFQFWLNLVPLNTLINACPSSALPDTLTAHSDQITFVPKAQRYICLWVNERLSIFSYSFFWELQSDWFFMSHELLSCIKSILLWVLFIYNWLVLKFGVVLFTYFEIRLSRSTFILNSVNCAVIALETYCTKLFWV